MELQKLNKYYGFHAKIYDLTRPFFLLGRKKFFTKINFKSNEKVLDLACGTGMNLAYIKKIISERNITAIDYSTAMLKAAAKNHPKIKFLQGDVSKYNFKKKFDKIICTYSLSMIDDWKETIKNVKKHLKKNGKFLILDFHSWSSLRPVYYIFRKALARNGVYSDRKYETELKKYFKNVSKETPFLNYYTIYRAFG